MSILTKEDALIAGELMLKQHNAITSGRYDFSSCQLDLVFMLLSQVKEGQLTYQIHTTDIELITGRKWNITQFSDSTEQLLTRMFEVETDESYIQFVLFQYFKYIKGTRTIEVKLSEMALPYFFDLKNNFTHFQLKSVLGCSSKFAKRLYMLACQWRTVGKFPKPIPILEVKRMLGLVDKKGNEQFKQIGQFKEYVLDIAKKQINDHTDISFDYELYKKGRSFEFIQIFVDSSKNKPKQMEINFANDLSYQKDVKTIMAYGISEEYAELIVKDGIHKFTDFVAGVNRRVQKGEIKVDNAPAYIIGSYQKKGVLPKDK